MTNLLSIVAPLVLLAAQAGAAGQGDPNVSVLGARLQLVADYAADTRQRRSGALGAASLPDDQRAPGAAFDRFDELGDRRVGKKYRASIVLRNDGPVTIRAVTWKQPLSYPRGRKPPESLTIRVRRDINPGQTLTLSSSFISAKSVSIRAGREVTLESVEYKDGSVWRRP